MIFNMGVAVTGKSWKKAIIELGTPAAVAHVCLGFPVSAAPTVDINAFSSEPSVESKRSGRGTRKTERFCFQSFGLMAGVARRSGRKPREG